jgi:protein-tyrosine phosphatase
LSANVLFVCWGNICRSPMAERVAQRYAEKESLPGVTFSSAGVSDEERGHPIDPRAAKVLAEAGYSAQGHTAHKVTAEEALAAAMVVGMEDIHLERVRRIAPGASNLYLLSNFDPDAAPGQDIPDPWYGPDSEFPKTLRSIEAAMPGLIRRCRDFAGQ